MIYQTSDNTTYWVDHILPIIHDSPESAYVSFIEALELARKRYEEYQQFSSRMDMQNLDDMKKFKALALTRINTGDFEWNKQMFNIDDFWNEEYPNFQTVDEWYKDLE